MLRCTVPIPKNKVPVAQCANHWPADIGVPSLTPGGRNLYNHKRGCFAHSLSLTPSYDPDMTEVLLKRA